jgi:hypothetical protein
MPTKENLVDLILMTMAQGGVIPDRVAVESQVDGYIVGFPHLSDSRDWILSNIL